MGREEMNTTEQALAYLELGWQVTPIMPRGKMPALKHWPTVKISPDSVGRFFHVDSNIGVVLGDQSGGLVDIDLDCPEAIRLAPEILPPTRVFGRAGSRRSHWIYYARQARTEKFQMALGGGKQKMLLELRANKVGSGDEGLQTVFPGSIHETGEIIEWEDLAVEIARIKAEPLRRAVARLGGATLLCQLEWSFDAALAFARAPEAADLRNVPDAHYERIARWCGLHARPPRGARVIAIRSPSNTSQPAAQPIVIDNRLKRAAAYLQKIDGAVSGAGGHDQAWKAALCVVRGFELSESEAYALLSADYNPRCDPPWSDQELRHKIADAHKNGRIEWGYLLRQERPGCQPNSAPSSPPSPSGPPPEWEPPIEFGVFDLPPFPTEVLPAALGDFVRALAVATQTPPDLAGMMVLAACAGCAAKSMSVEVKDGYREPLNLFTLCVLPSGHRKSAVLEQVTLPLREWESSAGEDAAPQIARMRQRFAISEKRLNAAVDRAAKAKSKEEREQLDMEVEQLTEDHRKIVVPEAPRLLADDATPEALGSLLAKHGGRIAILSPEAGVFEQMAGKYQDSPSLGVYLKAHAGDEIRVDRKGREPERVAQPALTIGISPQPVILEKLAEKDLLRGTGLLARFLYALPTSMLGTRTGDPPPIPSSLRCEYTDAMRRLLLLRKLERPIVLKFSDAAYAAWREFYLWVEPQLAEGGPLERASDWGSKLSGAVARIAGILGILRILAINSLFQDLSIYIEIQDVSNAVALGRYLVPHALAAFDALGADVKQASAKYLLKTIQRKGWKVFPRRDLQQATKGSGRFDDVDLLDQGLAVLVERGFIRVVGSPSMSERGRGRPAGATYEVNPFFSVSTPRKNSQNSQKDGEREPGEDDE